MFSIRWLYPSYTGSSVCASGLWLPPSVCTLLALYVPAFLISFTVAWFFGTHNLATLTGLVFLFAAPGSSLYFYVPNS